MRDEWDGAVAPEGWKACAQFEARRTHAPGHAANPNAGFKPEERKVEIWTPGSDETVDLLDDFGSNMKRDLEKL